MHSGENLTEMPGEIAVYDPSMAAQIAEMFNGFDELWPGSFGGGIPFDEQRVRDWLDDTSAVADLIALDAEGHPVGYCGLYPHWKDAHAAYISVLGVTPRVKGRKFGKRLLLKALETAQEKGISRVDLHTWSGNMSAVPLYKKVGMFWVPETSVYMQDYIPGLFHIPLAKEWLGLYPDWYNRFQRNLEQAPDKQIVDGMELYTYAFEAGNDRLVAEVDRYGWGFCGIERVLKGRRISANTRLKSHDILMGIPNSMTIAIANQSGHDLPVALTVEPFKGLRWTDSFPLSMTVRNGESSTITRKFVVDRDAKTFRRQASEVIKSRVILGDQVIELVTGGKIQPAVNLGCQDSYQIVRTDSTATVYLDLANYVDHELAGKVDVFVEGVAKSHQTIDFALAPEQASGIAIPVSIPADVESPVLTVYATPSIELDGAHCTMPSYRFPLVADVQDLAVVVQGNDEQRLNLLTDTLDIAVELEGGDIHIHRRSLPGMTGRVSFEIGPPFGINLDGTLAFEYAAVRDGAYLTLMLHAESRQSPGLQIRRYVRVAPRVRQVEHWATLTSLHASGALTAGGRVHTGGRGGLSISPFESVSRAFTPVGSEVLECDAMMPMLSDNMVPQDPDQWQETWTAAQSLANGDFSAWFWSPDLVTKTKVRQGSLSSLESEPVVLHPGETVEAFHLWYGFSFSSLSDVRNRWNQLIGHKEISWAELQYGIHTVQPVEAHLVDENVVQMGKRTQKRAELCFATPYPLPGELSLRLPESWQGAFVTAEGTRETIPMPDPVPDIPALIEIELAVPFDAQSASALVQLHFSGEFELDFDLPLLLMDASPIQVEPDEIDGKGVLTVSNGVLRFSVPAELGGNLIRLEDIQGRPFLVDQFPQVAPKFFIDHHIGGIEPIVFPAISDLPFAEPENVKVVQVQEGMWQGVSASWTVQNQEKLRGQKYSLAYLTLPGSYVVRIRLSHDNPTPRRIRWIGLLLADIALQGSMDDTIIKVPRGTQVWTRNHVPKPFLSPAHLHEPWATVIRGDQSLTMLTPDGFHGTIMAFDLQVMLGGLLGSWLETEPKGKACVEFAVALNQPADKARELIKALGRKVET